MAAGGGSSLQAQKRQARDCFCMPFLREMGDSSFRRHGLHNWAFCEESKMPWQECNQMDERLKFIAGLLDGEKMAALCRRFAASCRRSMA
jgi:hypothetical protein